MNWEGIKKWSIWGVIATGLGVLITKFFDVLTAMLGPEVALRVVEVLMIIVVAVVVAIASIIASWVITEVFKRARYPEPNGVYIEHPDGRKITIQPSWKEVKPRLWLCSITWNAAINGGFLLVMYQPLEPTRHALIVFGSILVWTAVVCGIGLAAYDVFVIRFWHVFLLKYFPTKYVKLADGRVVKRPIDQPSNREEGEKTQLPDFRE